jgi:hypothetical protein
MDLAVSCSKPGCRRPPRPNGRYCKPCFAQANRASHARHRKERNLRRRNRAAERDDDTQSRDNARAKLGVALARGTIVKGPCVACGGHTKVTAYIANPALSREVVWVCREHRRDEIAKRTPAPDPAELWQRRREAALRAIAALPEPERARLHAIAARGPAGIVLRPEAPLFLIRLVQAYEALRPSDA